MERALEKARKAVAECNVKSESSYLRAVKAMLSAVASCREYIKENAQSDRGCAQRITRELDEILEAMPGGSTYKDDKTSAHTRRLAEARLEVIEKDLSGKLKMLQQEKTKAIHQWVQDHPILKVLKKLSAEQASKGAYALLFEELEASPVLVTQSSKDGRIFTRFKMQEFRDDAKVYNTFHKTSLVGAAVILDKALLQVIGAVPAPENEGDQLKHLLAISNQAAGAPVKDFLENNRCLKELQILASRHKMPKQSYILLFQKHPNADDDPELVLRISGDGKTITRFWPNEFADKYKLYDNFRDKPPIRGAAVISQNELIHAFGLLPKVSDGQTQLQVILALSRKVMEMPMLEFLAANDVLSGLHELVVGQAAPREAAVLLFTMAQNGILEVLPWQSGKSRQSYWPSSEFMAARLVHEQFSKLPKVVGASVLSSVPAGTRQAALAVRSKDGDGDGRRRGSPVTDKPVVLVAFGRTPLKAGHLASSETLRRLGIVL